MEVMPCLRSEKKCFIIPRISFVFHKIIQHQRKFVNSKKSFKSALPLTNFCDGNIIKEKQGALRLIYGRTK